MTRIERTCYSRPKKKTHYPTPIRSPSPPAALRDIPGCKRCEELRSERDALSRRIASQASDIASLMSTVSSVTSDQGARAAELSAAKRGLTAKASECEELSLRVRGRGNRWKGDREN